MPWTAKQLKLFRAAAHNPTIAKSHGLSQAKASEMSKEGLKKAKGGSVLKQTIGNRDTKHGLLDLPVSLGKAMKKPKMRFQAGGDVDEKVSSMQGTAPKKEASKEVPKEEIKKPTYTGAVRDRIVTALGGKQSYKKGGVVRCRDGCAVRGKTKGRML